MKRRNHWIMGSAIGLATIAVIIDHTRHRLPPVVPTQPTTVSGQEDEVVVLEEESPCSLDSPCTLDSPCSLDASPCGLD